MIEPVYAWTDESFEADLSALMVLCYEAKICQRVERSATSLTEEHIETLRRIGPYVPSDSRPVIIDENDECGHFDVLNDPLPVRGVYSAGCLRQGDKVRESFPDAYAFAICLRQVDRMPKGWYRDDGGKLYEIAFCVGTGEGMNGRRGYFTVNNDGIVRSCYQKMSLSRSYSPGRAEKFITSPHEDRLGNYGWGSVALQWLSDRRFCWVISAQEKEAKAHLGCMQEEVKSLLYARSLPLTSTGRKRPIMHLVESHRRRIKQGIDVDVQSFLRGQQTVVIGDTCFTVTAPTAVRNSLSRNSQRRYQWRSETEESSAEAIRRAPR